MAGQLSGKLRLLYVLDILKKYSDEDNPLDSSFIIDKLSEHSIKAERKAIYDDIAALEEYGLDIIKTSAPKKGWFIGEREFEIPEIHLLCDAVCSAKFISSKKTSQLLAKLNSMQSVRSANDRKNAVFFRFDDKCDNEEVYYTIDKINRAISDGRQIKLEYITRILGENRGIEKKCKEMIINPYALAWQDDYYYLLGNHQKYDNLIHLRVDKIHSVEILKTKARHFSDVSDYKDFFDTADYLSRIFGMFSGELYDIELSCNKRIAEQVFDRFSTDIFIKNVTDNEFGFRIKAALSPAMVTWIMNYGSDIKVKKPEILKEMIIKRAKDILNNYENA